MAVVAGSVVSGITFTFDARAADGPSVGMVTKVENQAQVGGVAAAVGSIVHMKDTLSTGAKSRLQVTFRDQTNLTLGENASLVVDRFVFDPDASVGQATLNATRGAFRLATGKISEMTKKDINVQAPFAALAVRGTDFWGGPIQGQYGVLLVSNSRLEVRKEDCTDRQKCRCAVTLDQGGQGTDIDREGGCPGAKYLWPPEKVDAALSMTSFSIAMGPAQTLPAVAGAAAAAAGFGVSTSINNNSGLPQQPPALGASP
jgi:hypothetical protein